MKQARILLISIAALAILIMAGCGGDQPPSDTDSGTYNDSAQDDVQDPVSSHAQVTTINITHEGIVVRPNAMSMEAAAQVGLQYIYDIFGENMAGMYMELEFSDWDNLTRTLWHGAVSHSNRNTLVNRARFNELNDEFIARLDAGEDSEYVHEDMNDLFQAINYSPARFYFNIDAVTGEWIDIWQTTPAMTQAMNETIPLHEYIDQEWDGDWEVAFAIEIPPQEIDELSQMAQEYAQRQFSNSSIASMNFESASAAFVYNGGGFNREANASFAVTNDAGRVAWVSIHVESRTVTSINTMSNDFIPMDIYERHYEGERVE